MRFPFLKMKAILGLCFFLTIAVKSNSQETTSLFLLNGVSQSSIFNPAIQNENDKLIIGLPFISGFSGDWSANTPFDALFTQGFSYSLAQLYDELTPRGKVNASGRISMFNGSLKNNNYTFRLSVSERMFATGAFDRDIVKIIRDGTEPYYGTNEYFGSADFHLQHFRELSFGVSQRIWEQLDIGLSTKILFGRMAVIGSDGQLSVETDTENEQLLVNPEGSFLLSGPFEYESPYYSEESILMPDIHPGDYFFQFRNLGVALDWGTTYRPNKLSEISVSILDLGFTTYKYNTFDVYFAEPARYSQEDLYQSTNPGGENYLEPREAIRAFSDTSAFLIDAREASERTLKMLPLTINFSGKYKFTKKVTAGINNQFTWFINEPHNMFAAFIQSQTGKSITLAGSLSVYNLSAIRPGFGMSWTHPKFQFYFSSNNILGIIQPTSAKHLNLSVGMNLLFDTQK